MRGDGTHPVVDPGHGPHSEGTLHARPPGPVAVLFLHAAWPWVRPPAADQEGEGGSGALDRAAADERDDPGRHTGQDQGEQVLRGRLQGLILRLLEPGTSAIGRRGGYDGRVTVAAVMLFTSTDDALADTAGRPAVRRMVEAAWAGGATPIVVVAADVDQSIAAALAGSPAVLAEPGPLAGAAGQASRGVDVATSQVVETDAALIWPGDMAWVDAETVTSLIERHGVEREAVLRPVYGDQPGWPALLPIELAGTLAAIDSELTTEQLIEHLARDHPSSLFDTGDPGTVHDGSVPIDDLPPYAGPPEPARQAPEWGAAAADASEEGPLAGPALAPYSQAADPEAD
jgi:CTP:molybdopterin cytidylyltransferase MocA